MKITISLLALIIVAIQGCSSKETVYSPVAPAAVAEVRTSKTDDDNTKLTVNVNHLADPQRLKRGADQYVIWVEPAGGSGPINVGGLKINNNLKGNYETTIPYENFRLFITPESNRVAQSPSGPIVFDKYIQR